MEKRDKENASFMRCSIIIIIFFFTYCSAAVAVAIVAVKPSTMLKKPATCDRDSLSRALSARTHTLSHTNNKPMDVCFLRTYLFSHKSITTMIDGEFISFTEIECYYIKIDDRLIVVLFWPK